MACEMRFGLTNYRLSETDEKALLTLRKKIGLQSKTETLRYAIYFTLNQKGGK